MSFSRAMRMLFATVLVGALALMARAGGPLCWEGSEQSAPAKTASGTVQAGSDSQERERLLAMGRELFFQKCGKCHDADGSKPMSDGPPLNERKVSEERVSRVVDARFGNATGEQRRAVKLHINNFMQR